MGRIKALDPDVVHKIAAGEIIVSPTNALKELIENSIDAAATRIDLLVKDAGHKLLQITDNGKGIHVDDLPLLCQRFATSKLSTFTDLQSIATLGFRGEALASISHIAHLEVRTKTAETSVATHSKFENGVLLESKKAAGVNGTQIIVEDLFYNAPLRQKALCTPSSKANEYQKIVDVVSKYAIEYSNVSFSVKRAQDSQPLVINANSTLDRIRKVYGNEVVRNLLELKIDESKMTEEEVRWGLIQASGYMTGLGYATKRTSPFVIFVNKRLVSSESLQRSIRKLYQERMPRGSPHFFVYLSLHINPSEVDVNIHPTKREVSLLHESEINDTVIRVMSDLLTEKKDTHDYRIQSYISTQPTQDMDDGIDRSDESSEDDPVLEPSSRPSSSSAGSDRTPAMWNMKAFSRDVSDTSLKTPASKPRYEYNLVRTDPKQQRLTSYMSPLSVSSPAGRTPAGRTPVGRTPAGRTPQSSAGRAENEYTPSNRPRRVRRRPEESDDEMNDSENENVSESEEGTAESEPDPSQEQSPTNNTASTNNTAPTKDTALTENSSSAPEESEEEPSPPSTPTKARAYRHESPLKKMRSSLTFEQHNLASVSKLIKDVRDRASPALLEMFTENTFVGIVDASKGLAALQWGVRLYLIKYQDVCHQLFYQIGLTQFANFGTIHLGDGLSLRELAKIALTDSDSPPPLDPSIDRMTKMAQMLNEYFKIIIRERDGEWLLVQLPLFIPGYIPALSSIPQFVRDLLDVNWTDELECMRGIVLALAKLNAPTRNVTKSEMQLIFDTFKIGFVPTRDLKSCVMEIANLPGLYRVFERC